MKKITLNREQPDKQTIETIADYFRQGKVVAYPADTVYGLGCIATHREAVDKIHKIKQRPVDKPLLVLLSDQDMLKKYFKTDKQQREYLQKYWPGPFSFLLKSKGKMAIDSHQDDPEVVARLPKNDFLIKIIERVGVPITSTSLNQTGRETLQEVDNIQTYINTDQIDLLVDGGHLPGEASSIIDIRDIDNIKQIR